jgi:hypothetical protein
VTKMYLVSELTDAGGSRVASGVKRGPSMTGRQRSTDYRRLHLPPPESVAGVIRRVRIST